MPYAAQSPADLLPPEKIISMSGLAFMQGILRGEIAGAPIAETLNFDLHEVEEGRVRFSGVPTFAAMNPSGAVHGGWYGALLDSALGCAVMTMVPKGSVYTTLEYKVNITRAIRPGTVVDCVAVVDHVGRSTGVAHADIRGREDGKVYATGSTTCIIMKVA
ncbi:PaaI family thioesterase [uncultured Roseobacter sp.]|uniref:PaaI family thioesterase n=1 Tax=uncultured Roseobacter sp. TaxID=114847 RepID=UPI002628149D|nr:PaaI family thioesterase [uncultured Roseobacter sp.]